MTGRISGRLVARLRRELPELGIPEGATLHRVYAEAHRDKAPLSWFALGPGWQDLRIGSRIPMGVLLRAPTLAAEPDPLVPEHDPCICIVVPEH